MAKILNKLRYLILIPILVIFPFSIKNVYAATIRTDDTFRFIDLWTSDTVPATYTQLFELNRNDINIKYLHKTSSPYKYNYIKFRDTQTNDYYLFIFTDKNNEITNINYDTSINNFTYFDCIPYSTCDWSQKSYVYHYLTDSSLNNGNSCPNYFNTNFNYNLTSQYACSWVNQLSSSNNYIFYITSYDGYNSVGLTNLINTIKDYEIEMPEGKTFSIDNVQIYPAVEPEEPEEPEEPSGENNLNKVYVPNYREGQCIEVLDKDTLRVFENENSSDYVDYFVNSHYLSKQGQVELDYEKNCSSLEFTSIGYYRNDFPQILFMIGSLSLFSIGFIFILFKRFRKR